MAPILALITLSAQGATTLVSFGGHSDPSASTPNGFVDAADVLAQQGTVLFQYLPSNVPSKIFASFSVDSSLTTEDYGDPNVFQFEIASNGTTNVVVVNDANIFGPADDTPTSFAFAQNEAGAPLDGLGRDDNDPVTGIGSQPRATIVVGFRNNDTPGTVGPIPGTSGQNPLSTFGDTVVVTPILDGFRQDNNAVTFEVIPEPSTGLLGLMGLSLALRRRR